MNPSRIVWCGAGLAALLLSAPSLLAGAMHGIARQLPGSDEGLVTINLGTGEQSAEGSAIFDVDATGAAVACDGGLYGFSYVSPSSGYVYHVDPVDGLSVVQNFTATPGTPALIPLIGFTFLPDGRPAVISGDRFFLLDVQTSRIEYVGLTGFHAHDNLTLGPAPDCMLYSIDGTNLGGDAHHLVRMDPANLPTATDLGSAGVPSVTTIEFAKNGVLYGENFGWLVRRNPDGTWSQLPIPGTEIDGMGFDEPSACYCRPTAAALPIPALCGTGTVTLDGSPSTGCGPGGLLYRWLDGSGNVISNWSPVATYPVTVDKSTKFSLEVKNQYQIGGCTSTVKLKVTVVEVNADAGRDHWVCPGREKVVLDGTGSSSVECNSFEYTWLKEGVPVQGPGPDPLYSYLSDGSIDRTSFTLHYDCTDPVFCRDSDMVDVVVWEHDCGGDYAYACAGIQWPNVRVAWITRREDGVDSFEISRKDTPAGPWVPLGSVNAHGIGELYEFIDTTPPLPPPGPLGYRIQEMKGGTPGEADWFWAQGQPCPF